MNDIVVNVFDCSNLRCVIFPVNLSAFPTESASNSREIDHVCEPASVKASLLTPRLWMW
jgi:hypothetical protein